MAPGDVHLDLGGIAKGWTADRAAEAAVTAGVNWVLVNAGGDLRVAGAPPDLDVDVEDPMDPTSSLVRLRLRAGALATSSVTRRSWGTGLHHLIDPRTGAPARSTLLQATVWAPTCAEAEIRATAAIIGGGPDPDLPGVFVSEDAVNRRHSAGGRVSLWLWLRAAGIGAYVALFSSVAWGLVATTGVITRRVSKPSSNLFHAAAGSMGLALLAIHMALLLVHDYIQFDVADLLLPWGAPYRAAATALGVIAMYAMVAVLATSWVRRRLPTRAWRSIHLVSVPAFIAALVHGVFAGTDTNRPWMTALYGSTGLLVIFLLLVRGFTARPRRADRRNGAANPRPEAPTHTREAAAAA